jgi:hypothetical protein
MGRFSLDPVEFIVSFRVNAEEKIYLEALARDRGVSVSRLLRQWFATDSRVARRAQGTIPSPRGHSRRER